MGEKTELKEVDNLVHGFEEIENFRIKSTHALLTLYYNNKLDKKATTKTPSLFSCHAFPVKNKNYDSTITSNQKEKKFSLFKKGAYEDDTNNKISFIAIQFNELTPKERILIANDDIRGSMSFAGKQAMMEVFDSTRQSIAGFSAGLFSSLPKQASGDKTSEDNLKRNIPLVYITTLEDALPDSSSKNSVLSVNGSIEV
jgi:hypothetical protein